MGDRPTVRYYDNQEYTEEVRNDEPNYVTSERPNISMKQNNLIKGSKFLVLVLAVLAVIVFGATIYSLDKRNETYSLLSNDLKKLEILESENVRLQSELDASLSLKNVEEYAENVLGMQKIDASQRIYIQIQTNDIVNISEGDESIIIKVKKFFENCLEYFKG